MKRAILSAMIVFMIGLTACAESREDAPQDSDARTHVADESTDETGRVGKQIDELPFEIAVDEQTPQDDSQIEISSDQPATIALYSPENTESELRVVHPDGVAEVLGQWTGDTARFIHRFPYGENHLIVQYGDSVYDLLIIAGPPPAREESRCEGAYIELAVGVSWEFDETSEFDYPAKRYYRIESMSEDEQGNPHYSLAMERYAGVEQKIDTIMSLDLYCSDEVIYITNAVQQGHNFESRTIYDEGTVYIPAEITTGTEWSRHGEYVETLDDTTTLYELTETISCTGIETIEIEAGEFEAAKVDYEIERVSNEETVTYSGYSWYVPSLGRVLSVGQIEGAPRLELVSYAGVSTRGED